MDNAYLEKEFERVSEYTHKHIKSLGVSKEWEKGFVAGIDCSKNAIYEIIQKYERSQNA